MTNPYNVLGVDRSATDDQIKAAYKALAQKYSADNYVDNPLSDLAADKLRDIDEAYDQIMAERRVNAARTNAGQNRQSGYGQQGYQRTASVFSDARSYLNAGNYTAAENILFNAPADMRTAEWNYLMGRCCEAKGWLTESRKYYQNAAGMEPNNAEYQRAFQNASTRRTTSNMNGSPYNNRSYSRGSECSGCDVCSTLLCADCCCECMGGDLIRCC